VTAQPFEEPPLDCPRCPRLAAFRHELQGKYPDWNNAPVRSFGGLDAGLLIVGLAPGMKGANRTGRPFTGDYAGYLLYDTLKKYGFARGAFSPDGDEDLKLVDCRISSAVKCLPPDNKPEPAEVNRCNHYLAADLAQSGAKVILALGTVAHGATLMALGRKKAAFKFVHGAAHPLVEGLSLLDSYHCSRYNTNTGRLTAEMFEAVFARARALVDA
jgi:uracil-DNA glycosylase family 4